MVTLLLDHTTFEVALSRTEKTLAFRRDPVRIPRSAIAQVRLTDDPWLWLRGVRSPGTHVPGLIALGTWRSKQGSDFAVVRGRSRPGVVIDLEPGREFERLVLTTRHGLALVRALDDSAVGADSVLGGDAGSAD